jgi:hypothetical protein
MYTEMRTSGNEAECFQGAHSSNRLRAGLMLGMRSRLHDHVIPSRPLQHTKITYAFE